MLNRYFIRPTTVDRINPDGYSYSRFCELYQEWSAKLDVVLRQEHRAGEKLFVDYAGATVPIIDSKTGEVQDAAIFVAVLGASSYTYAEATWNQDLPSWIGSHVRALEFFQGSTALVVPDNLKNAVTRPCRYEPDLNPTYQEMAAHYGMAVIPARVRKPRDKAYVSYCTSFRLCKSERVGCSAPRPPWPFIIMLASRGLYKQRRLLS